jgi:hypothetical protein
MTAEHIRIHNGVGFEWEICKIDFSSIWKEQFQQLCEFKAQFGHYLVPIRYSTNPKLGKWVKTQRHDYKLHQEGKTSSLTEERIRALEGVGFEWETSSAAIWNERFEQLREFRAQFGHCLVPQKYSGNLKLGVCVRYQRIRYRLYREDKATSMTAEHIRKLNGVGFEWETTARFWNERLERQLLVFGTNGLNNCVNSR